LIGVLKNLTMQPILVISCLTWNLQGGITKLNVKLLDDNNYCEKVRHNLVELLDQIPSHWNSHTKLEFTKVAICTAFS
jgi:hypothetical protein